MVKFTVEISNWAFCGDVSCTHGNSNEVGTDLEFEIVVKGSKSAKQEQSEPNQGLKFSLGSGEMILSKKVSHTLNQKKEKEKRKKKKKKKKKKKNSGELWR